MALINAISSSDLYHMACHTGRAEEFGYKGWNAIGDYLENLSDDLGEDLEVDIVAICCEYNHAESADDFLQEYPDFLMVEGVSEEEWEEMDENEKLGNVRDYLDNNTHVVCCNEGCIIWQAF